MKLFNNLTEEEKLAIVFIGDYSEHDMSDAHMIESETVTVGEPGTNLVIIQLLGAVELNVCLSSIVFSKDRFEYLKYMEGEMVELAKIKYDRDHPGVKPPSDKEIAGRIQSYVIRITE